MAKSRRIYVIKITSIIDWSTENSDEAYSSLKKAQRFVESHCDNPRGITPYYYESPEHRYCIEELILR